jgi:uncharacterized membrane protein YvbJ
VNYCPSCGAKLVPNAKFCPSCGQALSAPPPASEREPSRGPVVTSRKENPVTQGMKLGTTGCVGCLTMVVLFIIVVALIAHHH